MQFFGRSTGRFDGVVEPSLTPTTTTAMLWRRTLYVLVAVLALFLLGTVVVLSSISYFLAIHPNAFLTELEVPVLDNVTRWNASDHGKVERIPRILHQTWKSEILPVRWQGISQACRDMMPD
jgi:inositol phosphorylceramide mannosyltransferase catalytic subunit